MWDAIRAALIRDLSDNSVPISGKGEELTTALVGAVIYADRNGPGDLSTLAEQVKIYRDAKGEWCIDLTGAFALDDEQLGSVVVLIRLKRIADSAAKSMIGEGHGL